jgi:hypothetical protein
MGPREAKAATIATRVFSRGRPSAILTTHNVLASAIQTDPTYDPTEAERRIDDNLAAAESDDTERGDWLVRQAIMLAALQLSDKHLASFEAATSRIPLPKK